MTIKEKPKKDEQILGANYIIEFYNEIKNLTDTYSAYLNLQIELKSKYNTTPTEQLKLEEIESQTLKTTIQNLRFYAHKAQIHFITIAEITGIKITTINELQEGYNTLNASFIPQEKELTKYVLTLNKTLAGEIIQNLLQNSQQIINSLYPQA